MRKRNPKNTEAIKGVLEHLVQDIEKKGPGTKDAVFGAWNKIVGTEGIRYSRPVGLRKQILTIEIDNSVWFYALNLKKASILKDLSLYLKKEKIKDVKFRMGNTEK